MMSSSWASLKVKDRPFSGPADVLVVDRGGEST